MKKTKFRRLAAMAASLLCCLIFTVPAYAQSSEPQPETAPAPAETEAEPETQNPFTPDGTGTVVDNATDEDGKEFYTITTADESVFYLVIDKQKTSENVYFLNTVTTDDLLPLAEQGKEPPKEVTPEPEPKPTEPVEEVPEPEPEKKDSPLLSLLLIGAVVLAGGGIGYYFKIYKPKHEAPDLEDDYCEYEDGELEEYGMAIPWQITAFISSTVRWMPRPCGNFLRAMILTPLPSRIPAAVTSSITWPACGRMCRPRCKTA